MATYTVHFTLEKDWYIEAESEEDISEKLEQIDWSSVEEKVWTDGADTIDYTVVGDTDKEPNYGLKQNRDYEDLYELCEPGDF